MQLQLFNYQQLDTETRIVVQQRTSEIKALMKRTAQDIIEIGEKLIEVKGRLPHGAFGGWLEGEFEWNIRTAQSFMRVAEQFKNENFSHLEFAPSALYLLASPSTPEPARAEAIARAEAGETITHAAAKQIINEYKPTNGFTKIEPAPWETQAAPVYQKLVDENVAYVVPEQNNQPPALPQYQPYVMPDLTRIQARANNEYYTPTIYLEAALNVLGRVDLDPASSELANAKVGAEKIFTEDDDGLAQSWSGVVWLNPPYGGLAGKFALKLVDEFTAGNVTEALLLVNSNSTDTNWFQPLWNYALCFTDHRIDFDAQAGNAGGSTHGSVFVYLGEKIQSFTENFKQFGPIVQRIDK